MGMKLVWSAIVFALAATGISTVAAEPVRWTTYAIPETGTSVDLPSSIFTDQVGRPDGYGEGFQTADGRAKLTVQALVNSSDDSPAAFLAKKHPPPRLQYKRVTPSFFALSGYKGDKVWYNRCNFSGGVIHCVLINYPAREEHSWDDVVTRISLSLTGK